MEQLLIYSIVLAAAIYVLLHFKRAVTEGENEPACSKCPAHIGNLRGPASARRGQSNQSQMQTRNQ